MDQISFGIEIKCIKGKNLNRYYINDNSDFKDISGFKNWLLDSLSLSCALEVKEPLKKRILCWNVSAAEQDNIRRCQTIPYSMTVSAVKNCGSQGRPS